MTEPAVTEETKSGVGQGTLVRGHFITLEGGDGGGKTTQVLRLASRLGRASFPMDGPASSRGRGWPETSLVPSRLLPIGGVWSASAEWQK